jgi:hypothetical protein
VDDAVDWRIEYRITELMLAVLRRAQLEEPQVQAIISQQNQPVNTAGEHEDDQHDIFVSSLQSAPWQDKVEELEQELWNIPKEAADLSQKECNHNIDMGDAVCASDGVQLARRLYSSLHRRTLMAALASQRFSVHQVQLFDVIYRTFIDRMDQMQQIEVNRQKLNAYAETQSQNRKKREIGDKCAIILDDRSSRSLLVAIRHVLGLLGTYNEDLHDDSESWSLVIFHTNDNEELLRSGLSPFNVTAVRADHPSPKKSAFVRVPVHYRRLGGSLGWDKASALRASSAFYQALPAHCQRLLIFEDDAIMRRPARDLDRFMDFASVGAPFRWCSEVWCRLVLPTFSP